jgi:hypothetical protein
MKSDVAWARAFRGRGTRPDAGTTPDWGFADLLIRIRHRELSARWEIRPDALWRQGRVFFPRAVTGTSLPRDG